MTYDEATNFLFTQLQAFHRVGATAYKADLENTTALDTYFGHPHRKFKTIHVAGTNGKGSVSHMLASILQEAGYKTGLYTSPHILDFRERIKVNGEMIPESEVVNFVENHKDIIESISPSFFEMTVAMAFDFFSREKIDVAVVEVGLGGRLDSTNIIRPKLSIITNIGLEHTSILGDTYQKIAREKGGIIKKNIPVVIGETHPLTKPVFEKIAARRHSEIHFADSEFQCVMSPESNVSDNVTECMCDYRVKGEQMDICGKIPLCGNYQSKNIQTVVSAFNILKEPFNLTEKQLIDGIEKVVINTTLIGRWQVISNNPTIICDSGHNKDALQYVVPQLKQICKNKLHFVLGFSNDKNLDAILPLFPKEASYYFTKAAIERGLDETKLKEKALEYGISGNSYSSVKEALMAAKENASADDVIYVGGSMFVIAEVL